MQATHPVGEVADLHRAGVGDVDPVDLGRPRALVEPGAAAVGTSFEGDGPVHERPYVRLKRVRVLGEHRLLHLGDQALVGEVDAVDLHLDRLLVQEVVELLLAVLADRLVPVEEARLDEDPGCPPAVRLVAGDGDCAFGERLGVVEELCEVDI